MTLVDPCVVSEENTHFNDTGGSICDYAVKTVSDCSTDQSIAAKDSGVPGETIASVNGEFKAISVVPAEATSEKGNIKLPVSKEGATVPTKQEHTPESKVHVKIRGTAGNDHADNAYEFLVKWVGESNIHNSWISESELRTLAKRKLENYKAKYGMALINICKDQWCQPQRVIALRVSLDEVEEALIKWCGLPYDECTWERLDEPIMLKYVHLVTQLKIFERQALDKDMRGNCANARNSQELSVLVEQPKELKGGMLFPHQLEALNWLRKCWYKSKNVILADEMGLGKTVSACALLSSLCCEFKINLPCLVLVPLSTMPNWMAEFASWAPHLNVVEYHGSARARSTIRQYEWRRWRRSVARAPASCRTRSAAHVPARRSVARAPARRRWRWSVASQEEVEEERRPLARLASGLDRLQPCLASHLTRRLVLVLVSER
uniref:Uncharacterized protein n=1 Tax=Avena sativa TaxID=4498 RepID=A0ACD6AKG5_AVESA